VTLFISLSLSLSKQVLRKAATPQPWHPPFQQHQQVTASPFFSVSLIFSSSSGRVPQPLQ